MSKIKRFLFQHKVILSIMLLAACARFINLAGLPDGVYQDEAYGAYNTWSIMTAGIDSRGYHAPVYFVAWGSGMNVLYAYLALPLFRLFGASVGVFRLPQAFISLAGVFAFYILGRELFDKKMGYFMAFALAINPWSIMNARFGLESTLAPGMILFALTFLVLALKKNKRYLLLSAVFMAASLYSYALTWIALPVILILTLLLYWKQIPPPKHL
ncbi:MAG: glycosyltransferase family 39 protein [Blautia sp.]|nr:glycosyltransferase family 39 protein [Blautia sp.]